MIEFNDIKDGMKVYWGAWKLTPSFKNQIYYPLREWTVKIDNNGKISLIDASKRECYFWRCNFMNSLYGSSFEYSLYSSLDEAKIDWNCNIEKLRDELKNFFNDKNKRLDSDLFKDVIK